MSSTPAITRPNPAPVKVICLGLGRTGTTSLRDALEMLGFGPCYHMTVITEEEGKDFAAWSKIGDGNGAPEDFDALLRGYGSVLDYPASMYPRELYAAYPDAKYILTIRDPEVWEKSIKATILAVYRSLREKTDRSASEESMADWSKTYLEDRYHRGRLWTHAQQELLDHNERVRKIIPPEKLLVYEVGEGWDRLVQFLDVPKPETPFPHVNDTAEFQKMYMKDFPVKKQCEDKSSL